MLPSLFISHGSPMLALEPGASGPALARLAAQLPRPKAIVLVSAHWESDELLVNANPQPRTWHDFGGFPPALYQVQYPAAGDPALAAQVAELLNAAHLPARLDTQRPADRGVWVPLSLMYPRPTSRWCRCLCPAARVPRCRPGSARRWQACASKVCC
ncbi:hypothetical protein PHLH5_16310 [Pseudomonas sp. Cab53]|nr:hypothetical protein PHLH5_16310 [Pseudomonas sp. Cab53]